jgi:hypothetical protein
VNVPSDWFYIDHSLVEPVADNGRLEAAVERAAEKVLTSKLAPPSPYDAIPKDILDALLKADAGQLEVVRIFLEPADESAPLVHRSPEEQRAALEKYLALAGKKKA